MAEIFQRGYSALGAEAQGGSGFPGWQSQIEVLSRLIGKKHTTASPNPENSGETEDLAAVLRNLCSSLQKVQSDARLKKAVGNLLFASIHLNHLLQVSAHHYPQHVDGILID
jgi:hypothetical protein